MSAAGVEGAVPAVSARDITTDTIAVDVPAAPPMEFKRNPSWYHVQAKMMAAQAVLDQEDVQLHDIDEVSVRNTTTVSNRTVTVVLPVLEPWAPCVTDTSTALHQLPHQQLSRASLARL